MGDAEREQALRALGDHMSAGRLDIDEYGERTARVAASKTRGELLELFTDLPEPKPRFGPIPAPAPGRPQPVVARPAVPEPPPGRPGIERWQQRPLAQRIYGSLVPVVFLGTIALFLFEFRNPWIFVLPVLFVIIGGTMFGEGWSHDRRAWEREQHRRRRDRRHRY
ncbi:uncharacterized protein DUF1707 [Actinocrispum wychmicini]|uniref:Uncharacterized protein DUF1707 n=1 Tax=Actinocrispum wychmicini TaxID=1213861 RepID=A0A4R2KGN0_9PSEU|nr:uncharacterized protein DUF1707 [Actinocrispum wychmicini]